VDPIGRNGALIQLLMDAAVARQRVIAKNLANVDTPGFKAQEVRFSRDLKQALERGDRASISDIGIETADRDGPVKPDGNSVDLDRELSELSGNALAYQALVTMVAMKTNLVRSAIAGRSV
jgi:flagellar basal-body rod protein FlgB